MRRFIRKLFAKPVTAPVVSKKPTRARLGLESMETREVLSTATLVGSVLTVNGTAGSNAFEVRAANANSVEVLDNGVRIGNFPFSAPVISRIDVHGLAGSDKLTVTSLPALIGNGRLTVDGTEEVVVGKRVFSNGAIQKFSTAEVRSEVTVADAAFLAIRNDADTVGKTINVTASAVTGLAPKPVTYSLGGGAELVLQTGDGGEFINVNSTFRGGRLDLFTNGGNDTVILAGNDSAVRFIAGADADTLSVTPVLGSLDKINGRVDFFGLGGQDTLNVNDRAGAGLGPTANPNNFIYNATVSSNQITRQAASLVGGFPFNESATIGYGDVESVGFNASTRALSPLGQVRVASTSGTTFVDAGAQDARVGDLGKLDGIRNPLTVNRSVPGGTLTIDDSAQTVGHTYDLGASSVTEPGIIFNSPGLAVAATTPALASNPNLVGFPFPPSLSINFNDNVKTVRLLTGSGADKIRVNALRAGVGGYSVDAGAGSDTVTAPNRDNVFTIGSPNSATLDSSVALFKVENLVGNAKDDRFQFFFNNGKLDGRVDGAGGGFDTLDYSLYGIPVNVNLLFGFATHVAGNVTGIENVYGGSAGDTLGGSSGNNVLVGNGGADFITGNGGADLLIGGDGVDSLNDRSGTAIYIGGKVKGALTTDAGLKAVEAEWARTDLPGTPLQQFDAKAAHLKFGFGLNGAVRLDTTTLTADHLADKLDPNPAANAFDLFVIDLQDTFQGANTPSDAEKLRQIVVL
jgi:hypothetical protein